MCSVPIVEFSDRFSASRTLTLDSNASVAALRFSRYRCAAARLAARVRSTWASCFECEQLDEDFRLPLRDAEDAWKSFWTLSSSSPSSVEDVLLVDLLKDQVKEPDRLVKTVLGLDLSNVPLSLTGSSTMAQPELP